MRAWRPPGRLWAPCGPKVGAKWLLGTVQGSLPPKKSGVSRSEEFIDFKFIGQRGAEVKNHNIEGVKFSDDSC